MSTRDLIDAIAAGDSLGIEKAFESAMASRIVDRLDAMRQNVAKNMFKESIMFEEGDNDVKMSRKDLEHHFKPFLDRLENDHGNDREQMYNHHLKHLEGTTPQHVLKKMPRGPRGRWGDMMSDIRDSVKNHKASVSEEIEALDEAKEVHPDALHVEPVGKGKYKVHAVGKNFSDGIKAGEHLSDTELDDFHEMGGKIKHVKPAAK